MSNYSVLMVDDEEEVIRIIRRKINWEELGFQVCGQAGNGLEALEMIEELQPDVVMTDIKMPYMDGLELVQRLREKNMGIHTIVLSGFDEFEYVKQAISLEVEEYLLKPIDSAEILKVFQKVKKNLDDERDLQKNMEYLEKYYQQSIPILREGFFAELMENSIPEERLAHYMQEYGITLTGPCYSVVVVHTSTTAIPEGITPRLLQMSVRQLLEKSQSVHQDRFIFNYRDNLVVLVQMNSEEEIANLTDEFDRFCKYAKRSCQATVTAGIGHAAAAIQEIAYSYTSAREAVSYRTLYGAGSAINIAEIDTGDAHYESPENAKIHEIFKQIKMGTEESVEKAIREYVSDIQRANLSLQAYEIAIMEFAAGFYRFLNANEIDVNSLLRGEKNIFTILMSMDSLDALSRWLIKDALNIREQLQGQRNIKTGSFVGRAKTYIQENFSDPDMNIDMVCSELGLSSTYFSTIFKKETGKTFVNYLTEIRMKEAERLLIEEDEKTYIIAEKVGFTDSGYFSFVFKKWFGVSPMKYKKQRK